MSTFSWQGLVDASDSSDRKKKRVLMVVENCPFRRDPRVRKETRALLAAGYGVSVICPGAAGLPWREVLDGALLYQFPPLWSISAGGTGYILEYVYAMVAIALLSLVALMTDGFDVIHLANPPDCIVLAVAMYKLLGTRIIYDQHDLCPELYFQRFQKTRVWLSRALLLLEAISYRMANHVIVTNDSYKEIAIRRGKVHPAKITVVRNGPDVNGNHSVDALPEVRSKSRNIIAFAGIIGYQDGLDYLCRALRCLRYDLGREDFYCIILGEGDAIASIKSLVHELGLDDVVWFAGWVSDPKVYARYLASSDICVSPEPSNSYNDRSTFVKMMEYMNAAKPIIAFDLPESRFSARAAAIYARPNDEKDFAAKIAILMNNAGLRASMGELGRRRIQRKLAWQYSVPNLLQAYKETIDPRRPPWTDPSMQPDEQEKERSLHTTSGR